MEKYCSLNGYVCNPPFSPSLPPSFPPSLPPSLPPSHLHSCTSCTTSRQNCGWCPFSFQCLPHRLPGVSCQAQSEVREGSQGRKEGGKEIKLFNLIHKCFTLHLALPLHLFLSSFPTPPFLSQPRPSPLSSLSLCPTFSSSHRKP